MKNLKFSTKAKKPNSSVKGDVPKKLVEEFKVEYSKPMQIVYNSIMRTGEYPRQWVKEEQVLIPKSSSSEGLDSFRSISKTNFFSKVFESFLKDWIWPIVSPYIDKANYGGLKGDSPAYYLIDLLHFVNYHVNSSSPKAVLLAQADLRRAFNSVSHKHIILDLFDMQLDGWILRIVFSYLSNRNMTLKFRGIDSSTFFLTGSCPQGVFLSVVFFIISFNGAFLRPRVPRLSLKCKPCISFSSSNCLHPQIVHMLLMMCLPLNFLTILHK